MSVIYLLHKSPHGSSILPSIASSTFSIKRRVTRFRRTAFKQWYTRTCSSQMAQPADHSTTGGLLHSPSHPYLYRRLFSSADTCCHQQLLLSEVGCPLLPGLSSRQCRTFVSNLTMRAKTSDRPEHCFQVANLAEMNGKTKIYFIK